MMSESEVRDLFAEAGDEITTRPAPVDELVRDGRRTARVRRGLQVGGVVAVVGLVIAAGLVWRPATEPAGEVATPPHAPAGMRLVGMGRVAVAVPEDWGTNDVGCDGHSTKHESVVFDSEGSRSCRVATAYADVSSLHIVGTGSHWARRFIERAEPARDVDGVPIAQARTREDGAQFTGALIAETEDVVMWVASPDPEVVDDILNSVIVLPEGFVTVPTDPNMPLATTLAAMQSAGLEVNQVEQPKPGWSAGALISSDPPLGSVVPVGSTVTLVVTGEPTGEIPIATSDWKPGDVGMRALIAGVLHAREDGCLSVGNTDLVWPAHYSAARKPDGSVVVMRPDGQVVAQTGRPFEAGGGSSPTPSGMPCRVGDTGEAFLIQDALAPLPAQVQVPGVVGLREHEAVALLEDLQLHPTLAYRPPDAGEIGTVVDQSAQPGVYVEPGTEVQVVVIAPMSVPAADPYADRQLAEALYELAASPSATTLSNVPFARQVQLGLADQYLETVDSAALSEPDTWRLQVDFFRAYVGPFSVLDLLRDSGGSYDVSVGPHSTCAVENLVLPPASLSGLRQISIQAEPADYTSCIDWWSVDVFVDDQGEVAGVTLDLYEP